MSCLKERVYRLDSLSVVNPSDYITRYIIGFYCGDCRAFAASYLTRDEPELRQIKQDDIQYHLVLGRTPCDEAALLAKQKEKYAGNVSGLAEAVAIAKQNSAVANELTNAESQYKGRMLYDEIRALVTGKGAEDSHPENLQLLP